MLTQTRAAVEYGRNTIFLLVCDYLSFHLLVFSQHQQHFLLTLPQPSRSDAMAGHQHPVQEVQWDKHLLGCCGGYGKDDSCCSSFGLCLKATYCPCLVLGKTMYRVEHPNDDRDMTGYKTLNKDCGVVCLVHSFTGGTGWHIFGWM